jgi:hypothetical protein
MRWVAVGAPLRCRRRDSNSSTINPPREDSWDPCCSMSPATAGRPRGARPLPKHCRVLAGLLAERRLRALSWRRSVAQRVRRGRGGHGRRTFQDAGGSVYIVRRPAAETYGESVEMEFLLPSGCVAPAAPHRSSSGRGVRGAGRTLRGRSDGWRTLARGECATVRLGAVHTFRNHSGGGVRVRNWQWPAMRVEDFIEQTCRTLPGRRQAKA